MARWTDSTFALFNRRTLGLKGVAALVWVMVSPGAWAQSPVAGQPSNFIFQCTTAQGRILNSDRMIAECADREQRVMTRDGVVVRVIAPSYTAEERAALDAKQAKQRALEEAKAEAMRRDRQLMRRFADEASHAKAREAALDPVVQANRISEQRLGELNDTRKPLLQEAEFYKGKALPLKLRSQFDTVDATEQALKSAVRGQKEEMTRINENYDIELERLKKLWAGATPGSMGPMREARQSAPSAASGASAAVAAGANHGATSTAASAGGATASTPNATTTR